MKITELTERLKTVKVKDTELLFRDKAGVTYELSGLFYGVQTDAVVAIPQVGEEPNCVVAQITPITPAA